MLARLRRLAAPLERRAQATPEVGARTTVWCATSPDAVPGGYHVRSAPAEPSSDALDVDVAARLWDETSAWVDAAD